MGMGRIRPVVLVGLGLLLMAALQGCGRSSKSSSPTLTMWLVGSEAQAQTINQLAEAFAQQTGIRVHCEAVSWSEAHSKYLTAVAGGVQPDIGTMGLTWGAEFGRLGALVDLQQAFPEELAAIRQNTFAGLWHSVEDHSRVFGIPFDLTLQVLYYRTDLISTPPDTWDELTALLTKLRADGRRMVIDWGNLSWIGYAPFLWQAGGDFYAADQSAPSMNTPQAVQALEFFRDLYSRYQVPRTSIPVEQGLRTGEFPLAVSGNWKIISLTLGVPELAGHWTIGLLPKGPSGKRTAFLGGRILAVFANSPRKADAWRFLRYLFEPAVQARLFAAAGQTQDTYLPPNMAAWQTLPMDPAMKDVLRQQASDAKGPPVIAGWNDSTHVLEAAIQRVVLEEANPKTELQQTQEAMARALQSAVAGQ